MTSRRWSRVVALVLALAAGRASAVTLFSDDMEAGPGPWVAVGMWRRINSGAACGSAHGGVTSWYYGNPSTCTYQTGRTNAGTLTTPFITIPPGNTAWVEFFSSYETEPGASRDLRLVQVAVDRGGFRTVKQLADEPMLSWQKVRVDLSAHAGHQVRVRFVFDTVDAVANAYRGWYIDDVTVGAAPAQYLAAPATFSWIDVPAHLSAGLPCDECQATRAIGFPFNFYGATYGAVNVTSNGYVTFAAAGVRRGGEIPSPDSPNAVAAPFWDDLKPTPAGLIYAGTLGTAPSRKFVVTWDGVASCCDAGAAPLTFQLILSETDNTIVFQYADVASPDEPGRGRGGAATIGLENQAGSAGFLYAYHQPILTDGLALAFHLDRDGDGISDIEERDLGTDPLVSDLPPVLVVLSGPGTTAGTAFFEFDASGAPAGTTGYRVYYGIEPGVTPGDYLASFDLPDPTARGGYIDQRWGLQGVPAVFFRVAPINAVADRAFVGVLSNEHAAYFAPGASQPAGDPSAGATRTTSTTTAGCSGGAVGVPGLVAVWAAAALRRRRRAGP